MKTFSVLASLERESILNLGFNLLVFPLQRKPRMLATFAHTENAKGNRFSMGLWLDEENLTAPGPAPCPGSQLRGQGPIYTLICLPESIQQPRADQMLISQCRVSQENLYPGPLLS